MEDRFHDGLQVPLDDFLGNPVRDRRNPQWSGFCLAIALRTIDPPNRWRKVAPRSQSVAGSTMLRLWPTGSSVGIAPVDSDPVVLLKPFGPRLAADALPSEDSPMAAPGQPIRVLAFAVVPH